MSRTFHVRIGTGEKYEIVVNEDHTYSDFIRMLNEKRGSTSETTFKIIYTGKIIKEENFHTINTKAIIIAIPIAPTTYVQPDSRTDPNTLSNTVSNQPTASTPHSSVALDGSTSDTVQSIQSNRYGENLYNYRCVKASIIIFLNFIRSNPQINKLYEQNYDAFMIEVVNNPNFDSIIKNILEMSEQISHAMDSGQDVKIDFNRNNDGVDTVPAVPLAEIDEIDEEIINDIISMGFDASAVIKTYVELTQGVTSYDEKKVIVVKKLLEYD